MFSRIVIYSLYSMRFSVYGLRHIEYERNLKDALPMLIFFLDISLKAQQAL